MLEAFRNRLRDLREADRHGDGQQRERRAENEAKLARALADEFGVLKVSGISWREFKAQEGLFIGSEHVVDLSLARPRLGKITIPPAFGCVPVVVSHQVVNLRDDPDLPAFRQVVEFVAATPLEYLDRWVLANEVFQDDVELESVIEWPEGELSFGISQPQYDGELPTDEAIAQYFENAMWTRISDPSGHSIYFNYAFNALAIDVHPRNCYLQGTSLLPFDVILCHPDEGLSSFLNLWPG